MRLRIWNAVFASCFGLLILISPASAQIQVEIDAKTALLGRGPLIQSGLTWEIQMREDDRLCALSEAQVRAKVARMSPAVQNAGIDIWSAAKQRCELRKYGGFVTGFPASGGGWRHVDLRSFYRTP